MIPKNIEGERRIARVVLLKSFREQPRKLFVRALWRYIKNEAEWFRYNDGFVEWYMVEDNVDEALEQVLGIDQEEE